MKRKNKITSRIQTFITFYKMNLYNIIVIKDSIDLFGNYEVLVLGYDYNTRDIYTLEKTIEEEVEQYIKTKLC